MNNCTCNHTEVTINAGTRAERTETRTELDINCPEHGIGECLCMWGKQYGDWEIYETNPGCPEHGDGEDDNAVTAN